MSNAVPTDNIIRVQTEKFPVQLDFPSRRFIGVVESETSSADDRQTCQLRIAIKIGHADGSIYWGTHEDEEEHVEFISAEQYARLRGGETINEFFRGIPNDSYYALCYRGKANWPDEPPENFDCMGHKWAKITKIDITTAEAVFAASQVLEDFFRVSR